MSLCYGVSAVQGTSEIFLIVRRPDTTTLSNVRKSTLLKCIAHLDLYSGQVLFKGQPPAHYGRQADIRSFFSCT